MGLAVQPPLGLSDEEVSPIAQKISDEIGALGIMVVHADALDPACVPDPACVEQTRAGLPEAPSALLVVELVRVGPVLQLTASGAAGDVRAAGTNGLDDAQLAKGPVLPPELREWARALAAQNAATPPVDVKTVETELPPETRPPEDGGGLSPMRSGAIALLGVGVVAAVAGGIVAGTQESVLGDAASTGDAKSGARTLGLIGLAAAAVGAVGVAGGAALFILE